MESSVHHSDSPSVNSSLSDANPSILPCNYGENTTVNYLHENPVKSPTVSASYAQPVHSLCVTSDIAPVHASSVPPIHTSCVMSVFAPVHASPIPSVLPYDNERQEFQDGFPGTNYGEKTRPKLQLNFPTTKPYDKRNSRRKLLTLLRG